MLRAKSWMQPQYVDSVNFNTTSVPVKFNYTNELMTIAENTTFKYPLGRNLMSGYISFVFKIINITSRDTIVGYIINNDDINHAPPYFLRSDMELREMLNYYNVSMITNGIKTFVGVKYNN